MAGYLPNSDTSNRLHFLTRSHPSPSSIYISLSRHPGKQTSGSGGAPGRPVTPPTGVLVRGHLLAASRALRAGPRRVSSGSSGAVGSRRVSSGLVGSRRVPSGAVGSRRQVSASLGVPSSAVRCCRVPPGAAGCRRIPSGAVRPISDCAGLRPTSPDRAGPRRTSTGCVLLVPRGANFARSNTGGGSSRHPGNMEREAGGGMQMAAAGASPPSGCDASVSATGLWTHKNMHVSRDHDQSTERLQSTLSDSISRRSRRTSGLASNRYRKRESLLVRGIFETAVKKTPKRPMKLGPKIRNTRYARAIR